MERSTSAALAFVAIAATAVTVALTATSDVLATPTASALVRGATVAAWTLCGIRTWERRPASPLGPLMLGGGLLYALSSLNAVDAAAPFTLGSLLWPSVAFLVIFIALSFPSGRLPDRRSRGIALTVAGSAAVLWGLLLLMAPTMPTPTKPFHCATGCPSNPFSLVTLSDGAVDAVERAAVGLYALSACVMIVVLAVRLAAASATERRILLPPALALWIVAASFALVPFVGRDVGGVSGAVAWLPAVFSVAFPVALLLGQAQGRLFAAASLRDMVGRLSASPAPRNLEALMADALGDPSLRLAFPRGQRDFVDGGGTAIALPPAGAQSVTEVRDEHGVVALILHDPALEEAWPGVVAAAGAAILLALENARLDADLRASARALESSRARMLTGAVAERRELERDLHDMAQQRLVALQIKLGLARERAEAAELGPLLDRLSADVEATIDSVRDVGRGLYPPLLADRGLRAALTSARAQASSTARLSLAVGELGRADPDLEAAVYVCCRAVIELLAAPGAPAAGLTVNVGGDELLIGVACEPSGSGASNGDGGLRDRTLMRMRDHVVTLGGWAEVATSGTANGDGAAWALSAGVPWPQCAMPRPAS